MSLSSFNTVTAAWHQKCWSISLLLLHCRVTKQTVEVWEEEEEGGKDSNERRQGMHMGQRPRLEVEEEKEKVSTAIGALLTFIDAAHTTPFFYVLLPFMLNLFLLPTLIHCPYLNCPWFYCSRRSPFIKLISCLFHNSSSHSGLFSHANFSPTFSPPPLSIQPISPHIPIPSAYSNRLSCVPMHTNDINDAS